MKISTKILIGLFILLFGGLFASNMILKNTYESRDKTDRFINFNTILQAPFKHIKIAKSALSGRIFIEKSDKSEVKITKAMSNFKFDSSKMFVKNDTLFMSFTQELGVDLSYQDAMIYILTPEILSIEGLNSNFKLGTHFRHSW